MFDFDELDANFTKRDSAFVRSASAEASSAPVNGGGPPSLESLLEEASDSEADERSPERLIVKPAEAAEPQAQHRSSTNFATRGQSSDRRLRVPVVPPVRGSMLAADGDLLQWMAQKSYLGQDMFLIGDPGPHLRNLALRFAAQTGRETEYIGITRDTTEADLKQRREISNGQLASWFLSSSSSVR